MASVVPLPGLPPTMASSRRPSQRAASPSTASSSDSSDGVRTPDTETGTLDLSSVSDALAGIGKPSTTPTFVIDSPTTRALESYRPLFLSEPYVHRSMVQGRWKTVVATPKGVDRDEWLAINLFDFWRNLNHVDEVISQHVCNAESCPRMTIGPGDDVLWADNPRSAAAYIDSVCAWVEMVLNDKTVFPTEPGRALSLAFSTIARRMFVCLLRIYAHIYYAHFDTLAHLSLESHTNALLAHVLIFGLSHELLAPRSIPYRRADALPSCRELDPSDPRGAVLGGLLKAWSSSAIGWVPKELRPAK